nr:MAG TPA: tail tape measure protein [Caudoviricetes sp.]
MAASGVGQFSINVKSNLRDFYGDLTKSKRTLKELTDKKHQLQVDSAQLDKLRDKSQRIAAEMKELRQQKNEIKLGLRDVEDAEQELKNIDKSIASLNRQKLEIDAEIQPIRTANVELHKVDQEIDRLNSQKVEVDFGGMASGLDSVTEKVIGVTKALVAMTATGAAAVASFMKDAVNQASDLEQNTGGIEKLYGDAASIVMGNSDQAYKTAGVSQNEYLEQAASFSASLIKDLNGDQAAAAEAVNVALQDMSDNANVFGTDMYMIQNAYEGFAKQNYTMLDNLKLGYGGNQTGAKQLVDDFGELDHKVSDISEVTMPVLIKAIHNAQESMSITGTTAKEAAETYEGSFKQMKAAWADFLTTGNADKFAESLPVYLDNLNSKLSELSPKIIDSFKKMAKELPEKIKPIIKQIANILTESLDAIFGYGFTQNFKDGMKPIISFIKGVFSSFKNIVSEKDVTDLSWLGGVIPLLIKTIAGLKVASTALKGLDFVSKLKIPKFNLFGTGGDSPLKGVSVASLKDIGTKLLTVAGMAGNIWLAAKALQEVDKIKIGNNLPKKLLNLGAAVTAMGAFSAIVGGILKIPGAALIIGSGAATIVGLSLTLKQAAKAIQTLDDVKINGDYVKKIEQIGVVLAALSKTSGGLIANNIFTIIGNAGAMINDWLKEGQLKSFARMADIINQLAEMKEIKTEEIKAKLRSIDNITDVLSEDRTIIDYIPFINRLKNLAEMGDAFRAKMQEGQLSSFVSMMKSLETIQGGVDFDTNKIKKNISAIKKALEALNDSDDDLSTQRLDAAIISKLFGVIASWADAFKEKGNASKLKSLVTMLKSFETISDAEISPKKIGKTFENVKEAVKKINESGIGSIKLVTKDKNITDSEKDFAALSKMVTSLKTVMENINSLGGNINIENIRTNIPLIGEVVSLFDKHIKKGSSGETMSTDGFKGFSSRIKTLKEMMSELNELGQDIPNGGQAVRDNIAILSTIFNSMNTFMSKSINDDLMKIDGFKGLKSRIIILKEIIEELEGLSQNIPNGGQDARNNIGVLGTIFNSMNTFLNKKVNDDMLSIEGLEGLKTRLDIIKEIMGKLEGLSVNIPDGGQAVKNNIGILLSIFDKIQLGEREFRHVSEMLPVYQKGTEAISALINTINTINVIPTIPINYEAVYTEIENVRRLLVQINDLPTPVGLEQIQALIQEFKNLVDTLNGLAGLFKPVGEGYGKKVIEGFKSVDLESPASEKIRKLLSKLISMKYQFREAGKQAGIAFSQGLSSKLSDIDLSGLSSKIRNAINSALSEKYSTKIDVELVTTETKKSSSSSKSKNSKTTKAGGGLVSVKTPQAVLTDSPEKPLLDNGEYVVPKKIVSALGVPFLEKLRSGQISRTFAGLAQSVSHTTSSVVNNNYHNDNRTQSYNVYTTGEQNLVLAANRRFRMA